MREWLIVGGCAFVVCFYLAWIKHRKDEKDCYRGSDSPFL